MAELLENDRLTGPYVAVEGQTDFPADFPVVRAEAVRVLRRRGGADVVLTPPDISVEDVGAAGFTARLATPCEAGDELWVYSDLAPYRPRAHVSGGATRTATLENDATEAMAMLQEFRRDFERAYVVPIGGVGGALPDLGEVIQAAEDLAAVVGDVGGLARKDGANITEPDQKASFRGALGAGVAGEALFQADSAAAARAVQNIRVIKPEDYRGEDDPDDTLSLQAALAAHAADAATTKLELQDRTYVFRQPLSIAASHLNIAGGGCTLLQYSGAATTVDIFTVGTHGAQIHNCMLSGFRIDSTTTMTGGAGLHLINLCRSALDHVVIAGQDGSHNLWHGIWFDKIDQVTYSGFRIRAQKDGLRVNGAVGVGAKAGLFLDRYKIGACETGVRIGGAFGGIYFGLGDLANPGCNVQIDQSLANEPNREVLFSGVASPDQTTDPTRASIIIDQDGAALYVGFDNTWVASSAGHGIWIKRAAGSRIVGRVYCYNHSGDGLRVDDPEAYVVIDGYFTNNGGWDINPTVPGHNVMFTGGLLFGVQGYNPTHLPARRVYTTPLDVAGSVRTPRIILPQTEGEGQFVITRAAGGHPLIEFGPNVYLLYNRHVRTLTLKVLSGDIMQWREGGFIASGAGAFSRQDEYYGLADGAGVLTIDHGDSNFPDRVLVLQGFFQKADGALGQLGPATANGTSMTFAANAEAAGRPCRVYVRYREASKWA